jgi:glycerophosphoryl diester phosphodiesterase
VTGRIRVQGHRGAAAHAPENTIASLERGAREGADDVEFDVQRTADGVPVLLHDDTLDRTTRGSGPLRAQPWAAVSRLDAGNWFHPSFATERVPSLEAVCVWAAHASVGLSVELKQPGPGEGLPLDDGLAASVVRLLRERGLLARALIHSFDHPTIARVLELAPEAVAALIYSGPNLAEPLAIAHTVPGISGVHVRWYSISRALCTAAHHEGLHVHAYGLPEPLDRDSVLRMVDLGVDSLSADAPDALVALLAGEGLR